ncbi:hypothetical protein DY240_08955 [Jiangella rhizosphaerae]|uniref:Uncharacterized protein n=1 Tax=Jiangella rhizosphaerae TaxID=2293569 RepID=A0A418KSU2_9ACTN|nr:hypothetical protein DY240_08955 [Jiangella rhizosphaerae]
MSARTAARTARETLAAQRRIANEDRLWHQRAETYVALLNWAAEQRARITAITTDAPSLREFSAKLHFPADLDARMVAYASGTVYAAARRFVDAMRADASLNADALGRMAQNVEPEPILASVHESAARSDACANRMAQLISDDLHGRLPDDDGRAQGIADPAAEG